MNDAEKFLRCHALITKANAINAKVAGMTAFNQSRLTRGESVGYSECNFFDEAQKLDEIAMSINFLI